MYPIMYVLFILASSTMQNSGCRQGKLRQIPVVSGRRQQKSCKWFSSSIFVVFLSSSLSINAVCTVKRPKFGIGPLVRHPLSELLKNHISAWAEVSDLVQRGERLYLFFCTNKKLNIWGSPYTLYDLQQLGPCMSKLGLEKCDCSIFPP